MKVFRKNQGFVSHSFLSFLRIQPNFSFSLTLLFLHFFSQVRIEAFYRFVLEQIQKECIVPIAPEIMGRLGGDIHRGAKDASDAGTRVAALMGIPLCEKIWCIDKTHVTTRITKSVVTMLRYAEGIETFSDLVRHSIRHERRVRGWCEKCKKYQVQRHVRSLITSDLSKEKGVSFELPPMLAFTCSTSEGQSDKNIAETFWHDRVLPRYVAICLEDTNDEGTLRVWEASNPQEILSEAPKSVRDAVKWQIEITEDRKTKKSSNKKLKTPMRNQKSFSKSKSGITSPYAKTMPIRVYVGVEMETKSDRSSYLYIRFVSHFL